MFKDELPVKTETGQFGRIVEVVSGGYKLKGNLVLGPQNSRPVVLIGHGAAFNDRPVEDLIRLQNILVAHGYTSMVIHNRGVGRRVVKDRGIDTGEEYLSEGPYKSRIEDRVVDFESAANFLLKLGISSNLILFACSLNGETAALTVPRLGEKLKAVALFEPAAYAPGAEEIPIGTEEFTKFIRKSETSEVEMTKVLQSPTFQALRQYRGPIFVAYGGQDKVIPGPVQSEYERVVQEKKVDGEYIKVAGAQHTLSAYAPDSLYSELATFLDRTV